MITPCKMKVMLLLQLLSTEGILGSNSNETVLNSNGISTNLQVTTKESLFKHFNKELIDLSSPCSSENLSGLCSAWMYCDQGECKCAPIPYYAIQCTANGSLSVHECSCITHNELDGLTEVGQCIYHCEEKQPESYQDLPTNISELNEVMCAIQFNRSGTLCGKCKSGYYPLVYSFDMNCVKCPNGKSNWWKFVLAAFLPLTVFYFIVLFFKINIASSNLQGFVLFSQYISVPAVMRMVLISTRTKQNLQSIIRYSGALYGIWNLDFFRSFNLGICLGTDTLQTLSLDLAVGIYPLLLMMLSYLMIVLYDHNFRLLVIIWKPFRIVFGQFRRNWEVRTSLIDAFATFFLLSNFKFLSVSFDLLAPVQVYQLNTTGHLTTTWRLYYDATVPYFGERHLPYAIIAIVVFTLFVLLPVLLFILYPFRWFQRLLNLLPVNWYILHTFMDSYYCCYKDGTQPGTRDCRWIASMFFLIRFVAIFIYVATYEVTCLTFLAIVEVLFIILLVNVQPFKAHLGHYCDNIVTFNLLNLLFIASILGGLNPGDEGFLFYIIMGITGTLPLLYISVIILHWMYSNRKFGLELIMKLRGLEFNN